MKKNKVFKKIMVYSCTMMLLGVSFITCDLHVFAASTTKSVSPRSDHIEWRYKIENGKKYRRLYNYTKDIWIGEWILIG